LKTLLATRLGTDTHQFDVARLFKTVIEVANTEGTSSHKMSVKGRHLLNLFLGERRKHERFTEAQKAKK
jgi:hypothetical protein